VGHIEDRWYKMVKHPSGRTERVKTSLFGVGLRYRVRYVGPDGRERKKSFPDRAKREAEAYLVSTESDKLRGAYIDPVAGQITFAEYAEGWLRTRSFDESTRESTGIRVRKHLLPYFGRRSLSRLSRGTSGSGMPAWSAGSRRRPGPWCSRTCGRFSARPSTTSGSPRTRVRQSRSSNRDRSSAG
jgi:hypothetical protein